jgi:hypothetical protein
MNEMQLKTNEQMPVTAPMQINGAIVSIEQERAIAEAQGKMIMAKRFPRSLSRAYTDFMQACENKAFAQIAFYAVPNRGSGPSIRFAEEAARCYGNFECGFKELSRTEEASEIEVYAWDVEMNNYLPKRLSVKHVLDTKFGPKPLKNQTDIDNCVANVAAKQLRGRILASLPKWLIADGINRCKATLEGGADTESLASKTRKLVFAFSRYGVTIELIEAYFKHDVESIMLDEYIELVGIGNALKEGAKASDYFGKKDDDKISSTASELEARLNKLPESNTAEKKAVEPIKEPVKQAQEPKKEAVKPVEKVVETVKEEPVFSPQVEFNDDEDSLF